MSDRTVFPVEVDWLNKEQRRGVVCSVYDGILFHPTGGDVLFDLEAR